MRYGSEVGGGEYGSQVRGTGQGWTDPVLFVWWNRDRGPWSVLPRKW